MKIGFDNEKYLKMQSEHIRERIGQFDNKLYLEFGGKLFDDFHASRVLPGFQPDSISISNLGSMSEVSLLPNITHRKVPNYSKTVWKSLASKCTVTT